MAINWTKAQSEAIYYPSEISYDESSRKASVAVKKAPYSHSATVTAAAGSGKTALLVERVIKIICDRDNPVPADKIAVMTFTRNAAEEFRRRMTDAVAEAARKDKNNSYLADQLIKFRSAPITTINSFCLSVLRERPELFGLPVSFAIVDETKAATMQAAAMDEVMEYFYSDSFRHEDRSDTGNEKGGAARDLLFKTFSFSNDEALKEAITSIYNSISSMADPEQWLEDCIDAYSSVEKLSDKFMPFCIDKIAVLLKQQAGYFNAYYSIADNALSEEDESREKIMAVLNGDKEAIENAAARFRALGRNPSFAELDRFAANAGTTQQQDKKGNVKTVSVFGRLSVKDKDLKDEIDKYRDKAKKVFKDIAELAPSEDTIKEQQPYQLSVITSLVTLVKLYGEAYTEIKRSANYVDFSDCEQLLLSELRPNEDLRKELSERYRCIIIDEFQDTNDTQYEIFRLISDEERNLFFVGDIKQAIYAFRGGNPRIMLNLIQPQDGTVSKHDALPLNMNFRSRKSVIDTVNAMFTDFMSVQYGDVDYNRSTALVQGAAYPEETADYTSELHVIETDKTGEDGVELEADYTARLINKLYTEKFPVKKDDTSTRPCQYGDFCILLRAKGSFLKYKKALEKYGIPVDAGSQSDYLASEEITLMLNYLRVIDNPLNDEPLINVLMSPIYMMTAEEIGQAKLGILGMDKNEIGDTDLLPLYDSFRERSLYACVSACARNADDDSFGAFSEGNADSENDLTRLLKMRTSANPKCRRFIDNLMEFRAFKSNNSIERLIRKIYDNADFFTVISTYEKGNQRLANIRLLTKYAADFENNGGGTLGDFLRYIDRVQEQGENFSEAVTAESVGNAVRLMTDHASKGLEMPIVILGQLGKQKNTEDLKGAYVFNRSSGIGIRHIDIPSRYHCKTFGYNAIKTAEEQKLNGEELRLMYVAMTRAREKLIMVGRCKKNDLQNIQNSEFSADYVMSQKQQIRWIISSFLRYGDGSVLTDGSNMIGDKLLNLVYFTDAPAEDNQNADDIDFNGEAVVEIPINRDELTDTEKEFPADTAAAKKIAKIISEDYSNAEQTRARAKFTVTEIAHMIDMQVKSSSVTDIESTADSGNPPQSDTKNGMVFISKPSFTAKGVLTGKEVGDAYHHAMEHYPMETLKAGTETTEVAVAEALERLKLRGALTDEEHKAVKAKHVAGFFNSELGQRMLKSRRIEREYPIFAEVSARDIFLEQEGMTFIQGRADMFFYEEDGIVLVDYKSDTEHNLSKELEAYSRQLSIYRTILPILTGVKVKQIYIYSFSCDMAKEV